jgi:predicted ribosome quality control (RQC) complex YloA/Tae2 family protein
MDGVPSAHVIIEVDDEPSTDELMYAAQLCIAQTKTQSKKFVHTKINNVRLAAKPGSVVFRKTEPVQFQLR